MTARSASSDAREVAEQASVFPPLVAVRALGLGSGPQVGEVGRVYDNVDAPVVP